MAVVVLCIVLAGILRWADHGINTVERPITWTARLFYETSWSHILQSFSCLPILAFAFSAHPALLTVFAELPPEARATTLRKLVIPGVILASVLFIMSGFFGYIYVGNFNDEDNPGDALNNYDIKHWYIVIAKLAMAVSLLLHIPPVLYPLRRAIDNVLFKGKEPSTARNLVQNLVILCLACLVAVQYPNIMGIYGLIGASVSATIVYIIPGLFLTYLISRGQEQVGLITHSQHTEDDEPLLLSLSMLEADNVCNCCCSQTISIYALIFGAGTIALFCIYCVASTA
jgi:amino acid permease